MKLRSAAIVLAAAGALLAAGAPAYADPAAPTFIKSTGNVRIDPANPRVGYIPAQYRCSGEGGLWASVKQVANRSRDPRLLEEGSSRISAAWSDSHRNALNCDGRVHFAVFTVDQLEPYYTDEGPAGPKSDFFGPLRLGSGYVQLCLFDDQYTDFPASDMVFRTVA